MKDYTEQDKSDWMLAMGADYCILNGEFCLMRDQQVVKPFHPDTDKADCFELFESLVSQSSSYSLDVLDGGVWDSDIQIGAYYAIQQGATLQEAICNLAAAIGRKMREEGK